MVDGQVLSLLVDLGQLALDLVDPMVLFLQLRVGFLLQLLDELALGGDARRVLPGELRFPALEEEIEDEPARRRWPPPHRRGP